jgi:hypothetical protein
MKLKRIQSHCGIILCQCFNLKEKKLSSTVSPTNIRADISKWLAVYYQLEVRNDTTIPIDFNSIYPDINARLL